MQSRGELIAEALDTFLANCPDIEGAAVVSVDGLPMASALPMHLGEDRLAAMAAALLSLGEKAADHLGRGRLYQLFLEGESGFVYLMAAGPAAVLCAISRPSAKTGLILYEMKGTARAVAAALASTPNREPVQYGNSARVEDPGRAHVGVPVAPVPGLHAVQPPTTP